MASAPQNVTRRAPTVAPRRRRGPPAPRAPPGTRATWPRPARSHTRREREARQQRHRRPDGKRGRRGDGRLHRARALDLGDAEFIARMGPSASCAINWSATCRARGRSRPRGYVDRRQFRPLGLVGATPCARARGPRCSVSACELTETYSPAAMDMAPATSPATPATRTLAPGRPAAATPRTRLAVDTMPSLAPMTAARSHPIRSERCFSS